MFNLKVNDNFEASYTTKQIAEDILLVHITAKAKAACGKLQLKLDWETDDIDVNVCFSPKRFMDHGILPNWSRVENSNAMSSAPILSNISYDDRNRLTIACSDAKNNVKMQSGVIEENAKLYNAVTINVDCEIESYSSDIRIDTRDIPFSKTIEDAVKWWETYDGFEPTFVPDAARSPLYSAWYSFHQMIDVQKVVEECRYFGELGCKVLIVDDGWQTDDNGRGYAYCGDWEVASSKIPDMKAFVDAVHETGLKFMLWYSVPFVGYYTKAYKRFCDKMLVKNEDTKTCVLDPRYPEVREYLIDIYRNAVINWGLDGFKLDFIDSFFQVSFVKEGMDFVSVYDAVDRLMKDVMIELKKLNPEILIEFRQGYIGPLMRTFGNMLRSGDCPNDSFTNRMNTLALRLTSGNTAVHSDMVMWNYNESVELAAFQLTNVLFSVPQISVLHDRMPESHAKMVKFYLDFWMKYREVLLDGEMLYKNYAADFTYVSSRKDDIQIGAVYSGKIAYIEEPTDEIIIINASKSKNVIIECESGLGKYRYSATDCMGNVTIPDGIIINNEYTLESIDVPVNGYLTLRREK